MRSVFRRLAKIKSEIRLASAGKHFYDLTDFHAKSAISP